MGRGGEGREGVEHATLNVAEQQQQQLLVVLRSLMCLGGVVDGYEFECEDIQAQMHHVI